MKHLEDIKKLLFTQESLEFEIDEQDLEVDKRKTKEGGLGLGLEGAGKGERKTKDDRNRIKLGSESNGSDKGKAKEGGLGLGLEDRAKDEIKIIGDRTGLALKDSGTYIIDYRIMSYRERREYELKLELERRINAIKLWLDSIKPRPKSGKAIASKTAKFYPLGSEWINLFSISNQNIAPFWILNQLNRWFAPDMVDGSKALFCKMPEKIFRSGPGKLVKGEVCVLRYNIFERRLFMQIIICTENSGNDKRKTENSDKNTGEKSDKKSVTEAEKASYPETPYAPKAPYMVKSAYPILIPSGRYAQPIEVETVHTCENPIEGFIDSSALFKQKTQEETNTLAKRHWLDNTAFAADFITNKEKYESGEVTDAFFTAIAEQIIIDPKETLGFNFDILPEDEQGKPITLDGTFQGLLNTEIGTAPNPFNTNPLRITKLHGMIESVEKFGDKHLFLNSPLADRAWLLLVKMSGLRVELFCVRSKVFYSDNKTKMEDLKMEPKKGQRIYAKARLQIYSANDVKNYFFHQPNFKNIMTPFKSTSPFDPLDCETTMHLSQRGDHPTFEHLVFDPFHYSYSVQHILGQIEDVIFCPVIPCQVNLQGFGQNYRFPNMGFLNVLDAKFYDLIGGQPLPIFKREAKAIKFGKVADERLWENIIGSLTKKNPRILSNQNLLLPITLDFLHFSEVLRLSRLSKATKQLIFENVSWWKKIYDTLSFATILRIDRTLDPKSKLTIINRKPLFLPKLTVANLRKGVRLLSLQNQYMYHGRQRNFRINLLATCYAVHLRPSLISLFQSQFNEITQECYVCRNEVSNKIHGDLKRKSEHEMIFMSCESCNKNALWTAEKAKAWFGIPKIYLEENTPAWSTQQERYFNTADLSDTFKLLHVSAIKPLIFKTKEMEAQCRKLLDKCDGYRLKMSATVLKKLIAEYDLEQSLKANYYSGTKENETLTVDAQELADRYPTFSAIVKAYVKIKSSDTLEFQQINYPPKELTENKEIQEAIRAKMDSQMESFKSVLQQVKGKDEEIDRLVENLELDCFGISKPVLRM